MNEFTSNLHRHRRDAHGINSVSGSLREIVYGGTDGIVTTFAVVAGFAGAGSDGAAGVGAIAVLLFGLANLFADATSMGLGAFLSARSHGDVYAAQRNLHMREILESPQQEHDETVALLTARGVSPEDATTMADIYGRNPELMADFMMRYELGMSDPDDGNPAADGFKTFLSFLVFGAIPLLPYFLLPPVESTFYLAVGATFLALVLLGLLRWRVTGEGLRRSVAETVLVGGICAVVAYAVGLAFR